MVWSEYVNETVWDDSTAISDDEDIDTSPTLNCDDWTTWHSEDLMNMWFSVREYRDTYQADILQNATYTNFCEFCYLTSYGQDEFTYWPMNPRLGLEVFSMIFEQDLKNVWRSIFSYTGFFEYAQYKNFCEYSHMYSK